MMTWGSLDDIAINRLSIDYNRSDTTLLALWVENGDIESSITQDTLNAILLECRRNTGVNLDAIIGGLDTQNELSNGVPVPCCCVF